MSTEVSTKRVAFVYKFTNADGKEFSTKKPLEMVVNLIKQGYDLDTADSMVKGMKPSRVSVEGQIKKDITALKKALTAVSFACSSLTAKKEEKREEYIRKSLASLDVWLPNSQLSRKQKFERLVTVLQASEIQLTSEVLDLKNMIESK